MRRLLGLFMLWSAPAFAGVECTDITFEGAPYSVCSVDLEQAELRLFLDGPDGNRLGSFGRVSELVAADGGELAFAMNAGMFHPDRSPVGLYIEDGIQHMRAIPNAGPGNFGMLPNGLLCLRQGRADVIETRTYLADPPACRHATQSGPMLVIDGELHPRFLPDSTSRHVRNGVGTSADRRRAVFAISNRPVTFHAFGRLFRDRLETPNALYLDGSVSRLYAPQIKRRDLGLPLGPIVGAVIR